MNGIVLPHWVVSAVAPCPGGAYPVVRAGPLRARQRLLPALGRDRARARDVPARGCERHVLGSRRPRGIPAPACGRPRDAPGTRDEMMTVAAARLLWDGCVCFVGIGLPSAACNLARLTHAPDIVLVYESGTIGTRPDVLPLSIGDGELAETAACVVPLPEVFSYLLQAGRVDVGFLGAAQIDRYGNLNSTVIGRYDAPKTRLPGAGGATEIAAHARQTFVMLKATPRSLVPQLDFRTSAGFLDGHGARAASDHAGAGSAGGHHRFRRAAPRPRDRGTAADGALPRRDRRGGARGHRLAAAAGARAWRCCRRRRHSNSKPCAHCTRARARRTSAPCDCPPEAGAHSQELTVSNPHIKTELPGPKARAMLARDVGVASPSYPARLSVRDVARPRHARSGTSTATASSTSPPASPCARPATRTRRSSARSRRRPTSSCTSRATTGTRT